MVNPRIVETRSRLQSALLAGESTAAIRKQLELLEQAEQDAANRAAQAAAEAQAEKAAAVAAHVAVRSAELARDCEARVEAFLSKFPIPQFERGTEI